MLVANHIAINMESLIQQCSEMNVSEDWYDNTDIGLYAQYNRVYTKKNINNGQFIGYIIGSKKYTWDVIPNSYIVKIDFDTDDSLCIDCNEVPRCITSMIRRGEYYNCALAYSFNEYEGSLDAYVISTRPIYGGEELILKPELQQC